ncbi:mannose-6-phosphate isomerase-like protein (cupin superfamily) [Brevundimonas alba]|uniref:Mannose-6-phosphate isomerase-like protein (Cupin superfamily) n=1 Tax=Brevundimonas alba TaxID=74314 RepID=A0A7X5YMA6_9CAUL|nr:cupin domain-containing protein [Brevundimonas alba]NJC42558.1 mannose-6-phosphate isomerase-like protein (cupin superfamily) [Brevundimonas alba]
MKWSRPRTAAFASLCILTGSLEAAAQTAPTAGEFRVVNVAERAVARLPDGPLYWRVESAPGPVAGTAAGDFSLSAEADGRAWLFTLGPQGARTPGWRLEAEIGPAPVPEAAAWTLRLNRAGGPPGARTPVHAHPGSEAFYVRSGQLCQRTTHGDAEVSAGQSMNGHQPGAVMQLTSCGETDLDQWVMFVLDSDRPFSVPASF